MVERCITFENQVAIGPDWTSLFELSLEERHAELVNLEIHNTGANAVSNLRVMLKDHPNGEWYPFVQGAQFEAGGLVNLPYAAVTVAGEVVETAVTALPAGARAHLHLRVNAAPAVRVEALAAGGSAAVVRGSIVRSVI